MALGLIAGAIGAIGGIGQIITGSSQRRQANRLEQQNVFPEATVNPLIQQNVANANNMAAMGIPTAQYNLALQNINRNQAGALSAIQRGGIPTSLASVVRAGNDSTMQLDAANAQQRISNQQYADQARLNLANEQQRVWDWNYAQPYMRNLQNIAQLRGASNQNTWGGIGNILGAGMNYLGTQAVNQNMNQLWGGGQQALPRTQRMIGQVTSPTIGYQPAAYRTLPV